MSHSYSRDQLNYYFQYTNYYETVFRNNYKKKYIYQQSYIYINLEYSIVIYNHLDLLFFLFDVIIFLFLVNYYILIS